MNSKKQGDAGVGAAIAYYTGLGLTVSIPLTDSQGYDLVVEKNHTLYKVQVKSCAYRRGTAYNVSLTIKGGNRTGTGKIKKPTEHDFDLLFVKCSDGSLYELPQPAVNSLSTVSLGKAYSKYKIGA